MLRAFQSKMSWFIFRGSAFVSKEEDAETSSSQLPLPRGGLAREDLDLPAAPSRYARYRELSPGPTELAALSCEGDAPADELADPPRLNEAPRLGAEPVPSPAEGEDAPPIAETATRDATRDAGAAATRGAPPSAARAGGVPRPPSRCEPRPDTAPRDRATRAGAVAAVEPPASANAPFANAIVLNTSPRSVRACRVPSASACAVRGSKFRCHRAGDVDVGSLMISADLVGKNLPSGFG
jgi:hypothetical protein